CRIATMRRILLARATLRRYIAPAAKDLDLGQRQRTAARQFDADEATAWPDLFLFGRGQLRRQFVQQRLDARIERGLLHGVGKERNRQREVAQRLHRPQRQLPGRIDRAVDADQRDEADL